MSLAVAMPTAAELMTRALEKFNPKQLRDPGGEDGGQWVKAPGSAGALDKLKLAKRIQLGPGERLVASGSFSGGRYDNECSAVLATVDTPNGRILRMGVVSDHDRREWRGAKRGSTVLLDDAGVARLDASLERLSEEVGRIQADAKALDKRVNSIKGDWSFGDGGARFDDSITPAERELIVEHHNLEGINGEGTLTSGPWGELVYQIYIDEEADVHAQLGVRPDNAGPDWSFEQDVNGRIRELRAGSKDLQKLRQKVSETWVERSPESFHPTVGVRMPLFRALEAFAVMSPSPAVRLMMLARTLEAKDSFSRRGKLVTVERGRGGKFAHKVGSVADAVAAVRAIADRDTAPSKPRAPRNAVAKALASGNPSALGGFDREPLRREAGRRGLDVPHGAHIDVIRDMLWDDENSSKSDGDSAASAMADGFGRKPTDEVRDAYKELQRRPGDWVPLADIREKLSGMSRDEQDAALKDLAVTPGVTVIPWDNTKALAPRDHDASLRFGGEPNHAIRFEPGTEDESPTAAQKRSRADSLLSDMPDDKAGRDRVHKEVGGLILDADRMDAAAKPARSRTKTSADTDAFADRIRNLPHKPESRAQLAAELDQLGAADMRAVADKWNIPLPKRTTKAQSRAAIEQRLDQLIDHDSVLNGGWDGGRAPASAAPDKPLSFFGQMKQAHADAMAADVAQRAARKAAAAEPSVPKASSGGGDRSASTVKAGLLAATSTDDARKYLSDLKLSVAELKQIATELDVPTGGGAKGIRDALVKIFATGRLTSDIFPGLRKGPDPKA